MITIVTGHPRSGTSMTMMMLDRGGILAEYDPKINAALNPYGSFETNKVTTFDIPDGKSVKCLAPHILFDVPQGEYKVIMPVRDPYQVIFSRIEAFRGKIVPTNLEQMKKIIEKQYRFLRFIVNSRADMEMLELPYEDYFQKTEEVAGRIAEFVGTDKIDPALAASAVDPEYYEVRTLQSVLTNIQARKNAQTGGEGI